jgi:hypothetical protein
MAMSSRLFRALAAASLAIAWISGASAAHAAPAGVQPLLIELSSGPVKFTAGGHTWSVTVADAGPGPFITISTPGETDAWNFAALPSSGFHVNLSNGNTSLVSGNSLKPIASFTLHLTPTSGSGFTCPVGSETTYAGTLAGSFTFTASSKLKFHSAHVRFRRSTVTIDYGCKYHHSGRVPCAAGTWDAGSSVTSASGTTAGLPGQRRFPLTLNKTAILPAPSGTLRSVLVYAPAPAPVYRASGPTLTVKSGSSGRITGSAVLTGQDPFVTSSNCVIGSQHYQRRDTEYAARVSTPTAHPLEAKSYVLGWIKLPAVSPNCEFDVATFKKA